MTIQHTYPLTEQQKGLWFEYKLNLNSNNYNCYSHHEIRGLLDETRFFKALRELMKTFDPFRLQFKEEKNDVFQIFDDTPHAEVLFFKDLNNIELSEEERIDQAKALLMEESLRPYDLNNASPTRLILIKVSARLFYFGIGFHHIAGDGHSFRIYYQFLTDFYSHQQNLSQSYQCIGIKEYFETLSRAEIYSDQAKEKSIAYWKEELSGRSLQVPFSRTQRGSWKNIQIKKMLFDFDQETFVKLEWFCRKNKITPFLFLSACFGGLVYRYWHFQSLVIGYIMDVRPKGFQNSPGFYVSMFPFRFDLEKKVSLEELASQIIHQIRHDKEYQNIVFSELVPYLRTEGKNLDLNFNTSVASTFFSYDFPLAGLEVTSLDVYGGDPPNDDLSLLVDFTSSDLKCALKYSPALFSENFITSFVSHFKTFISLALETPTAKISEICFLSEEEKQQLLIGWNDTYRNYPSDKTIHQLFEEQVEKSFDHTAVIFEEISLTYGEMNEKANQLAHFLKDKGVKSDTLVAIACERSLDMIIGILAILKAGGAYVPLNPSYPLERLAYMMEDTKAGVLLTQSHLIDQFPKTQADIVLLDQPALFKDYPVSNVEQTSHAADLAYVIYTSGSTGKPKGVMIEHKSVNRLIFGQTYVTIHSSSVIAQASNISFDAATFEIWGALLFGAKLVIIPTNMALSAVGLQGYVKKNNISIMWITKTLFDQLFDQDSTLFKDFNYLLIGGEALDPLRVRKIVQERKVKNLINGYGPTESTTFSVCCNLSDYQNLSQCIPIGRPISNTQVYLLDASLNPVSVGVVGELYIGGDGLARGYLNQPDLTAERFIENPFAVGEDDKKEATNLRLYKTGDLCRWLEDGNIEYVGRIDDQVKLRGFRIELGEIESTLKQHPKIKDGIVLIREDTPGDKRLVGYLIFKNDRIDTEMLKLFLKDKLPEYMIPSAFVTLDYFSLTPNGKVDRKSLPTPVYKGNDEKYVPPSTDAEKLLAEIWKDILKIEKIGIHDNFFELGGHSLLATQIVSRIRLHSQKEVSLKTFFSCPTIFELSSIMEEKHENKKKIPSILTRRREAA